MRVGELDKLLGGESDDEGSGDVDRGEEEQARQAPTCLCEDLDPLFCRATTTNSRAMARRKASKERESSPPDPVVFQFLVRAERALNDCLPRRSASGGKSVRHDRVDRSICKPSFESL